MIKEKQKKGLNIFPIQRKLNSDKITLNNMWHGDELPFALKSSLAFIYCFHLKTVNVFRRNGNEIAHESLCNSLKKNMNTQPLLSLPMIYDVCSAVKAYVRDIPNGLMEKKMLKEWHKIARLPNHEIIQKKLKSMIQKLPQANKSLLFHFLVLISAIIENQKENTMSSKSLSIVFLPSFFEKVVNITDIKELPYFVELLEIMILNAKNLVEPDIFKNIEDTFNNIGKELIIQSTHLDEEKPLEDVKRTQFVSQDSGLNSTSFLDDKVSQSLSNSSGARLLYHESRNSMEDLLNDSDCLNTNTTSTNFDENRLQKANSILSLSSISSTGENYQQTCIQQKLDGSFSCIGTKVHSIKDCRPHSIHDSPRLCGNTCNDYHGSSLCYKPVYDRSCFSINRNFNTSKEAVFKEEKPTESKSNYFLQRRKPIIKRSSCGIVSFDRRNKENLSTSSSTITVRASSITTDILSHSESCTPTALSSYSSIKSNLSNKIIVKYKPRRNWNSHSNRYTAPVFSSEKDIQAISPCTQEISFH